MSSQAWEGVIDQREAQQRCQADAGQEVVRRPPHVDDDVNARWRLHVGHGALEEAVLDPSHGHHEFSGEKFVRYLPLNAIIRGTAVPDFFAC